MDSATIAGERSTNLTDWQAVTNFTSTNALMPVVDPALPGAPRGFYRALVP